MKLSDFPFAEVEVENFKFGQRERHYDSSKTKTFTLLIILLAAIIIITPGTVAPTSSATVFSGGMVFRVWPHTGMSNRGTAAAGNSIVRVVDVECGIIVGTHSLRCREQNCQRQSSSEIFEGGQGG